MREIDLTTWRRRQHFELFKTFNHPHFSMCANLELTAFLEQVRKSGVSFTVAFVYVIAARRTPSPSFATGSAPGR